MTKRKETAVADRSFTDKLDQEFAPAWRPDQDGAKNPIVGTFLRMEQATTSYGACWLMILDVDGDEIAVWLLHTVLKNELARAKPKPGEKVAIKYLGKKTSEGGTKYAAYRVAVDRPVEEAFNWNQVGAEDLLEEGSEPVAAAAAAGPTEDDIPY